LKNKLILKSISSSEVDLSKWYPLSEEDVFICLDMEIAYSDGEEGCNIFYVTLATPEALKKHRDGIFLVKNRTLVISEYDYDAIRQGILEILNASCRDSWSESCNVLQRYFQWEYED
jgi:hypothetical protein